MSTPTPPGPQAPWTLSGWAPPRTAAIDLFLEARFGDAWPPRFAEAVGYPLRTGGKRIRPLLTIAAAQALTGDRHLPGPASAVVAAGAAVELVHTYSLVHDDLPALDDDDLRRGKPTVHKAYDEATAILVGDALLTEAFGVLAQLPVAPVLVVAAVRRLAHAAGHVGMIGGQAADIGMGGPVDTVDALMATHAGKTGALITAACHLGGLVGGADPDQLTLLDRYGAQVGLAFQLADDVLDADQDAGEDGPPSYVKLLGIDETRARALALADAAVDAATALPHPQALVGLARFAVQRDH